MGLGFTVAMVTFRIPADLNSFGVPVFRLEVCLLRSFFNVTATSSALGLPCTTTILVSLFGDGVRVRLSVILTQS